MGFHRVGQTRPELLTSSSRPISASQSWSAVMRSQLTASYASWVQVVEITGAHHNAQLVFVFLVESGFHHVGQAVLELLTS
ncbi:hypothetical protein AAY473_014845, partial [Plecturocebus cupreus]